MADSATTKPVDFASASSQQNPVLSSDSASTATPNELEKATETFGAIASEGGTRERLISEASSTAEDKTEENLRETCGVAFEKITQYLNGELSASLDDYTLLEKLNQLTTSKYKDMSATTKMLITSMEQLDEKYKSLQPYLEQIDRVEESVASLEQAAYRLDAYSKKLENKFKRLERR